jgi:hypothetical protein
MWLSGWPVNGRAHGQAQQGGKNAGGGHLHDPRHLAEPCVLWGSTRHLAVLWGSITARRTRSTLRHDMTRPLAAPLPAAVRQLPPSLGVAGAG